MSSYRDDGEALRARVEALESELHESKATLASQRADYERQLGRGAPPAAPKTHRGWLVGGAALVLLLGASTTRFIALRAPAPASPARFTPPAVAQPTPAIVTPPTPAPTQRAATVRSATGIALPRGTPCRVAVDSLGSVQQVRCDDEDVYVRRLEVDPRIVDPFVAEERARIVVHASGNDTVTLTRDVPAMKVVLHLSE